MDPFEGFNNAQLLHFQYIFNTLQHYFDKLLFFDIRPANEFSQNHFPFATNLPISIFKSPFTLSEISLITDLSKLRRKWIIIGYNQHSYLAEQLHKLLRKHKCKEIHMLSKIDEFMSRYDFLIFSNIKDYPNEIIPMFLYLGSEKHAYNPLIIKNLKITHILNATKTAVNKFSNIKYCKVLVMDSEDEKISRFFRIAYEFIEEAMHENQAGSNNVVLVHCALGVSRSATIVIMFLMRTFGMSLQESLNFLKSHRNQVDPNPGFIKQLEDFYTFKYKFSKTFAGPSLVLLE